MFIRASSKPLLLTYKTSHNYHTPPPKKTKKNHQNNNNNDDNNNRLTHNLVCGIVSLSISPPEDHGSLEVQLQVYSS